MTHSAISSIMDVKSAARDFVPTPAVWRDAPALSKAPVKSRSSPIASLLRFAVPRLSMAAAKPARPNVSRVSKAPPAASRMLTLTAGDAGFS